MSRLISREIRDIFECVEISTIFSLLRQVDPFFEKEIQGLVDLKEIILLI
jgi:hypothetical protein